MLYGLISPNEQTPKGLVRICEVSSVPFEVAAPLFWMEVPDHILPDIYGWNGTSIVPALLTLRVAPLEVAFPSKEGLQLG